MRDNVAPGWGRAMEGGGVGVDVLKMRRVNVIYYKIHFRVLLQPICAGEVSLVIVIDK